MGQSKISINDATFTKIMAEYGIDASKRAEIDPKLNEVNRKQDEFKWLLHKTPLEKYTQSLWEAFQAVACDALDFFDILDEIALKARAWIEESSRIAQQLLALLKDEQVKAGKVTITSDKALEALKQALLEEYKARGMNQRPMTFEEAQCCLKDWRSKRAVAEWIREGLEEIADEEGLTGEEAAISEADFDAFCDEPSNVEYYAESFPIVEEVTPEQVEGQIKLNKTRKKQGRKPKNYKLTWLILEIRRYYKRHRNEDYRLIFDCMDLFGLLDDVKVNWGKIYGTEKKLNAAKTSYIKSIYQPALRYETDTQPTLQARIKGIGMEFHDTL